MKAFTAIFVVFTISCHFVQADRCIECSRGTKLERNNRLNHRTADNVITPVISDLQQSSYIIGGTEAPPHSFPYVVFLKVYLTNDTLQSIRICGGALISPQWILTAAHCVQNADLVLATAGGHDIRTSEQSQQTEIVKEIVRHSEWESKTASNDLALLKLKLNLKLDSNVKTIRLPAWPQRNEWFWRSSVQVAGWGMTSPKEISWLPSVLRTLSSTVITNVYCSWSYGFKTIKDYHICTDGSKSTALYKGDGGDPLVLTDSDGKPTLIGIASNFTANDLEKSLPIVFTRVTNYLQWISHTTGIPLRE